MPFTVPVILAGFLAVAAPGQGTSDVITPNQLQSDQMQSGQSDQGQSEQIGPNDMLGDQDQDDDQAPDGAKKVQLTDTELFSALAGNIVGAATLCHDIAKDRVTSATDKVATLVSTTAADQDEQSLSKLLFMHNIGGGRQAVRTGEVECKSVDESLTKLEQFAQRAANATNSGGSE